LEKLVIWQKAYDCYIYLYVALRNFPKSEKFTLSADIKSSFSKLLKLLMLANKSKSKLQYLYEADVILEMLKFQIRAAKDMQFLKIKQYGILSEKFSEIGRMLGGWINKYKHCSSSNFVANINLLLGGVYEKNNN